jgi:hypothetical protein
MMMASSRLRVLTELRTTVGRTFHGYKEGQYFFPNDALEQDRLDMQHEAQRVLLDGNLGLAPIIPLHSRRVLDIATGTGIWAIEFARQHPESQVGSDVSLMSEQADPLFLQTTDRTSLEGGCAK